MLNPKLKASTERASARGSSSGEASPLPIISDLGKYHLQVVVYLDQFGA
jgi:hypothetical protein